MGDCIDCDGTDCDACNRCSSMGAHAATHLEGWHQLKENDHDDVIQALATVGPLVVGVAAGSWFTYSGGVFGGCSQGASSKLTIHAVQLVGYGTDPELAIIGGSAT